MLNKADFSHPDHKAGRSIRKGFFLTLALSAMALVPRPALAVGLDPVPVLDNVGVQAEVQRVSTGDPFNPDFVYTYTITNPGTNTGEIWYIKIDISEPIKSFDVPSDATLPRGTAVVNFEDYRQSIEPLSLPPGASVVPVGQEVPSGWLGGFGRDGFLGFASGNDAPNIPPGQSLGGFQMRSGRVPTLRQIRVIPDWVLLVLNHDAVTEEELDQAAIVEQNIRFTTFTLGPSIVRSPGDFGHWNQLRDDLNKMIEIGWIIDPALGDTLVVKLANARQALDQQDGTLAKSLLQELLDVLDQASPDQLRSEARQLIQLNAEALITNTRDTPIPVEPKLTVTPKSTELPVGVRYTLTAKVVNAAHNDDPIEGFSLEFVVQEGPHKGLRGFGNTNADGEAIFSYIGTKIGVDTIRVEELAASPRDFAQVRWTGGPDLVVPVFIPPIIQTEAGKTVFITDRTANLGTIASPPSVTRYFLSNVEPVDPAVATVIGERQVDALEPDESSDAFTLEFTVPSGFPPGTYFMAACADANSAIVELDEDNNCSFNQLETITSIIVPSEQITNNPPDCSQAVANPDLLWPPNHKLVSIDIAGITDPDGDPFSVLITRIEQDEPVNGLGDGDTSPDGFGVGTGQASVRAERSGLGNGRIYEIGFNAEDDKGGSCTGSVQVGVPHDQGQGAVPIDDGVRFDSTQP